jgi:phosphopantothenoylcysteine synthetase/decarboxylase
LGAKVTLVTGPIALRDPPGVAVCRVESAREMLAAGERVLPADVFIGVAAVADWSVNESSDKIKKAPGGAPPVLSLRENPDILETVAKASPERPTLVVGFAAETRDLIARAKRERIDCVLLVNFGADPFEIMRGIRIAQLVAAQYARVDLIETKSDLDETTRSERGFGSTGTGQELAL